MVHDDDLMRVAGGSAASGFHLRATKLTRIPRCLTDAPGASKAAPLPGSLEKPPLVTTPDHAPERATTTSMPLFAGACSKGGRRPCAVDYWYKFGTIQVGSRDRTQHGKGRRVAAGLLFRHIYC